MAKVQANLKAKVYDFPKGQECRKLVDLIKAESGEIQLLQKEIEGRLKQLDQIHKGQQDVRRGKKGELDLQNRLRDQISELKSSFNVIQRVSQVSS